MSALFPPETLRDFIRRVLEKAGAPTGRADVVAESLVLSNLLGHDSHGILLLTRYARRIQNGELQAAAAPEVETEFGATAVVNGHFTFGQVTARFGVEVAVRLARSHGVAAVALREATHVGRLGEYAE